MFLLEDLILETLQVLQAPQKVSTNRNRWAAGLINLWNLLMIGVLRKKGTEGLKFNHSNFSLLWPASFSLTYFDIIFIFDLLSESVIPNRLTIVRGLTY